MEGAENQPYMFMWAGLVGYVNVNHCGIEKFHTFYANMNRSCGLRQEQTKNLRVYGR